MKTTLIENFHYNMKNGKLIVEQFTSDINVAIGIILDIVDDVTDDEYDVLKEAMEILRKYNK